MKVREVQDPKDWGEIAQGFPDYCYEQTPEFNVLGAKTNGARVRYLLVEDGDDVVGAAAIRQKRIPGCSFGIAYIASGPLLREPDQAFSVVEALRRELVLRERNTLRFRPSPLWGNHLFRSGQISESWFREAKGQRSYETFLIDLGQPIEVLQKKLHPKWRGPLKQSDARGLNIESGRSGALIDRFSDLYREMREVKGFESPVDPTILRQLLDSKFQFQILIATKGDKDLGGHVVCYTQTWATYLLGASSLDGREDRVGYALMWRSILDAQKRGNTVYDLGGVNKQENPHGFQFKSRVGGDLALASGPFEVRAPGPYGFASWIAEATYRFLRTRGKSR